MNLPVLQQAVDALSRLPSIGRKSAWRLAIHILERPRDEARDLAETLIRLKETIRPCTRCFNYSETELCPICSSSMRDHSTICVVEKAADLLQIENAGKFRGVYHVLGGVLSPIQGITPEKLTIEALLDRTRQEHPREIILGMGGSADAETTALYLSRLLETAGIRITRLARGLPAGLDLEYVDQLTLAQALTERTRIAYGEDRLDQ